MSIESPHDIYVRHTGTDGKSYVSEHRVWDAERFIAAAKRSAADENNKQPIGAPRLARVEQITHDQFIKEKTK